MDPLGSAKEAFLRGAGVGAGTSAINYLSGFAGRKSISSGAKAELLSGIAGAAVSPFASMRDPGRGCGSASPFKPSIGYSTARGYRYDAPQTANQPQSHRRGFSLKEFLGQTLLGGLTGGFTSAAFYGAGKGIERIKEEILLSRGDFTAIDNRKVENGYFNNGERIATTKQIRSYKKEMQSRGIPVVVDRKGRLLKDNKAAGFDYSSGTIYIKKQAGLIDLYHEGYHAEQFLNIGQESYNNLERLAREEYVYEQIIRHSDLFNDAEIAGAQKYIIRLRGGK